MLPNSQTVGAEGELYSPAAAGIKRACCQPGVRLRHKPLDLQKATWEMKKKKSQKLQPLSP